MNDKGKVGDMDRPALMQFVRTKGKRAAKTINGVPVRDSRGKVVMERGKGDPRGILVAAKIDNKVRIGWSYTDFSAGDKFDKVQGLRTAMNRLESGTGKQIPHAVIKVASEFRLRAANYFKVTDDDVVFLMTTNGLVRNGVDQSDATVMTP